MNLLSHFDKFASQTPATGGAQTLRAKALEFLNAKGLPTRKDEDWKYTSLKVLNDESFVPAGLEVTQPTHETMKAIQAKLNPEFINIVFHNGQFNKTLSSVEELPAGVKFTEGKDVVATDFKDSFEALNVAYFTKNYTLEISPETSVDKAVNFVFYSSAEGTSAVMVNPRVTIKAGKMSSTKYLESYYGQRDVRYFVNPQVDVEVAESAKLIYVRLQAEGSMAVNVGRTNFTLGKASHVHSLAFSTGGILARHSLTAEMKAPEAFGVFDGVYVTKGNQVVDNTTVIDHQVGACNTSQHYKGILADASRAVFNGKVIIRQGAMKANSEQLNNNLLLSREAEADSKPQLEVYADDVKAGHGSTVGQLNQEELFYLQSRAISADIAVPMMSFGYASELIYKLENEELQNWLNKELREAFQGLQVALK
ncbi:MAG: SufD family Fe-S cluster assembly protein [Bdellovibrionales bacterium]|nr:SufD family Fe-S cluster assembly protein [Bdellovibrionales bacterium]